MSKAFDEACQALEVINRLIPLVEKLEEDNATLRADVARRQTVSVKHTDYIVQMQRLVEHLCRGTPIPADIEQGVPYHAAMAKAKQATEAQDKAQVEAYLAAGVSWDGKWMNRDKERLDAYAKMMEEAYPYRPYYSDGQWRCRCWFGTPNNTGAAERTFGSFRLAVDAALQESFE